MGNSKNKTPLNFKNRDKFNWDDLEELKNSCLNLVLNQFAVVGEINKAYNKIEQSKRNPEVNVLILGFIKSLEECFIRIRYNSERHIKYKYNISDHLEIEEALNKPEEFYKLLEDNKPDSKEIKSVKKGMVKASKKHITTEQYEYININSEYVNLGIVLRDLTGIPTYKLFDAIGFTQEDIKKFGIINQIVKEGGDDEEILSKINKINKKEQADDRK